VTRRQGGGRRRSWLVAIAFLAGVAGGWWGRSGLTGPQETIALADAPLEVNLPDEPVVIRPAAPVAKVSAVGPSGDLVRELRDRELRLPLDGVSVKALEGQFAQTRDRGARGHEAVDLLAPRNTPVHAVEDGRIAKLFVSKAGGNTIYQFDESGRACYYYAHLERYADDLKEGQEVDAGDIIGYVGTTGNAPKNTPHLHFAIFELTSERQWWKGRPIDPFDVYRD
jgi:murein DD-endopeptidase MepM/ murein hydrolase activator NlpD